MSTKATQTKSKKKKVKKVIPEVIVHIKTSFNNVLVNVTDLEGNTLFWSSSGAIGYKGAKKSTPYAARLVSSKILKELPLYGVKKLNIRAKGFGSGRVAALKQIQSVENIEVGYFKNVTPVPHNGVKKKKKYRRR